MSKIGNIIGLSCIGIVVAALTAGNIILHQPAISDAVTGFLCPPTADDSSLDESNASSQELAAQVIKEGSVLVKNAKNVLPLNRTAINKVNVFGHGSVDWIYGGSGSGQVQPETGDASLNVGILEALKQYGIAYNTELSDFYKSWLAPQGYGSTLNTNAASDYFKVANPDISEYSTSLLDKAKSFSDTAIVVLSRRSGESIDVPKVQYKFKGSTDNSRHYLEISTEEESMLKYVGKNFKNVIVLINSVNVMELTFLETIPGLDACLVVGGTGTRAASGIPSLLYGEVSPSGKLADTYAYELESNVNYNNVGFDGVVLYDNEGQGLYPQGVKLNSLPETSKGPMYSDYVEGIYVGYKWYETADVEGIWSGKSRKVLDESDKSITVNGYDAVVQYPFGYGLSYSHFEWTLSNVSLKQGYAIEQDTQLEFTIQVLNNGAMPAKDVVELYLTAPYTDGEIEKSHVSLIGYEKTGTIEPGMYQEIKISVNAYDLASYDCYDKNNNGHKGYELDEGTYQFKFMTDSHNVKEMTVDGKKGAGVVEYTVKSDINYDTNPLNGQKVENLFTGDNAIDGVSIDGSGANAGNQNISFISRSKFPQATPDRGPRRKMTGQKLLDNNLFDSTEEKAWNEATVDGFGRPVDTTPVTFEKKNGKVIYTETDGVTELGLKLGKDYNDPEWNDVLDQLKRSEAVSMVGIGATGTPAVPSVGKPKLDDRDGPAQSLGFVSNVRRGVGFPCAFVLAQAWNQRLNYEYGVAFGNEMAGVNLEGIFGFGCNIHRSPFGGRNFEYYSEDAFLSAKCAERSIYGLKTTGKYAFLKHFALAEGETCRDSYYPWLSEQALREIYLKPFQYAVERGGCVGLMTSYNRIGSVWCGGSEALLDGVLRTEWGFKGAVISDYSDHNQFMSLNHAIRHGGDLGMAVKLSGSNTTGVRMDHALRDAVHNVLYMWLNAQYTATIANDDYVSSGTMGAVWVWWKPLIYDIDILVGFLSLVFAYKILFPLKKEENKEEN